MQFYCQAGSSPSSTLPSSITTSRHDNLLSLSRHMAVTHATQIESRFHTHAQNSINAVLDQHYSHIYDSLKLLLSLSNRQNTQQTNSQCNTKRRISLEHVHAFHWMHITASKTNRTQHYDVVRRSNHGYPAT